MALENDIKIAIDSYDDLFSDFDISSYSERSISLDFKEALESKTIEPKFKTTKITLSIPKKERDNKKEQIISKRLNYFFIKKHEGYSKRIKLRRFNGLKFILMGFFFVTLTLFLKRFLLNYSLCTLLILL